MKTLGSCESFTGGLFAAKIIQKPGASNYFKGAIVAYASEIKEKIGINTNNGVINSETALAMAKKAKEFLDVDICVSFTGNAGPEARENKRVGHVFIAINDEVYDLKLSGNRLEVCKKAVDFAYKKVIKLLKLEG